MDHTKQMYCTYFPLSQSLERVTLPFCSIDACIILDTIPLNINKINQKWTMFQTAPGVLAFEVFFFFNFLLRMYFVVLNLLKVMLNKLEPYETDARVFPLSYYILLSASVLTDGALVVLDAFSSRGINIMFRRIFNGKWQTRSGQCFIERREYCFFFLLRTLTIRDRCASFHTVASF